MPTTLSSRADRTHLSEVCDVSDFHAQHSPFGAFASFTVGRHGKQGGFGLELAGPAEQDIYVALARPNQPVRALPFYAGAAASEAHEAEAYTGVATHDRIATAAWEAWQEDEIQRSIGWASDTWRAGDLTFRLLTPFGTVPDINTLGDDELRRHLCPAILAEITVDNTQSETDAFALLGIGAADPLRPLSDTTEGQLRGIACETRWGFAAVPQTKTGEVDSDAIREILTWNLLEEVANFASNLTPNARDASTEPTTVSSFAPPSYEMNRLANRGGLLLPCPAGETRTYTFVLGFYRSGIVTSGIGTSYLYTRCFADLEAVLTYAIKHVDEMRQVALKRDSELSAAPLSDARKFLLAHATHSYHGATMLLHDERAVIPRAPFTVHHSLYRPLWVVNEGEYRMMNTFDLTVDQAFWEMRYHSWTLRNTLDLFIARYSYQDDVQDAADLNRTQYPGGISFTHDMGVANQFSPPGYSAYERSNEPGCFSYMTHEQLCNWCLCAALYSLPNPAQAQKGDLLWLATRRATLAASLRSLIRRDGPDGLRDGIMSFDALRCGNGQEITTYDSLDPSLGQARASAYLAVKTWAAYLALSRCFDALGEDGKAAEAEEQAARAAAAIARHWNLDKQCLHPVFEPENPAYHAHIVPAIEGLVYPYLLGDTEAVSTEGPYGELIGLLRQHTQSVLVPGLCVDSESGGIKLSSTSDNTWMSKIFLSQFIAERILGIPMTDFDTAHARWQQEGDCRDFAFTDQVESATGRDLGSRYYPRGVTAVLWLKE